MIDAPAIDWSTVTTNLRAAGCPVAQIKRRAKIDDRTLNRLQRGDIEEPRFSQGLRLLDLHEQFCPDRHDLKQLAKGGRQ